jgi:hypothetical protein
VPNEAFGTPQPFFASPQTVGFTLADEDRDGQVKGMGDEGARRWCVDERIDFTEVGRQAHELGLRHGRDAHYFAAKLALQAQSNGRTDEHAFWKAVERTLTPRSR